VLTPSTRGSGQRQHPLQTTRWHLVSTKPFLEALVNSSTHYRPPDGTSCRPSPFSMRLWSAAGPTTERSIRDERLRENDMGECLRENDMGECLRENDMELPAVELREDMFVRESSPLRGFLPFSGANAPAQTYLPLMHSLQARAQLFIVGLPFT